MSYEITNILTKFDTSRATYNKKYITKQIAYFTIMEINEINKNWYIINKDNTITYLKDL